MSKCYPFVKCDCGKLISTTSPQTETSTPPPETPVAEETLEEAARRVVKEQFPNDWQQWRNLTKAIEAALRNERESQARKADEKARTLRRAIQLRKFPNNCELRIAETAIMVADDIARSIRKG